MELFYFIFPPSYFPTKQRHADLSYHPLASADRATIFMTDFNMTMKVYPIT